MPILVTRLIAEYCLLAVEAGMSAAASYTDLRFSGRASSLAQRCRKQCSFFVPLSAVVDGAVWLTLRDCLQGGKYQAFGHVCSPTAPADESCCTLSGRCACIQPGCIHRAAWHEGWHCRSSRRRPPMLAHRGRWANPSTLATRCAHRSRSGSRSCVRRRPCFVANRAVARPIVRKVG